MKPSFFLFRALALLLAFGGNAPGAEELQVAPPAAYLEFALTRQGNAERGKALFQEERLLCSRCHTVDGGAARAGPDLLSAGEAFGRRELAEAILFPSKTIAPGYGTVFLTLKSGESHQGVLKQKNADVVQLMGLDGVLQSFPTGAIQEQTGIPQSLMPEALHARISRQEFTDLLDYLVSLRLPASALASAQGMPVVIPASPQPVQAVPLFPEPFELPRVKAETGLSSCREVPGSGGVLLVLHQRGMIWAARRPPSPQPDREIFLDLTGEVFSERGPNGLLDVAFHPGFRTNRKYYLFYQKLEEGKVVSRIEERLCRGDSPRDSGNPARVLLEIPSVAEDHSGGCLEFGPDGFLYIVMGDTGPHHDPNGHAQNMGLLLGKMMRIDINHQGKETAYAIPEDNPFAGRPGVRPEIWATGLRNPWRFCIDRATGDLWLADVGQDRVEEVNLIQKGGNYGWNVFEGFEPFSQRYRKPQEEYLAPVFAYRHNYGNSITGGHVYRGKQNDSFSGVYVCADYNSKRLFGIRQSGGTLVKARQIGTLPQRIVSFMEDEAGEHYAVGYEGQIYQLRFESAAFE